MFEINVIVLFYRLSLFRIFDLIMTISIFILSLIISSVLTDGLNRTCNGFPESQQSVG